MFAAPVLYILGRLTTVGELHALALASLVFPLLAMVFVRWSRHRIGFMRVFGPKRIFAGNTVRIEITARNLGRLPTPPLILEDAASHAVGGPIRFSMPSLGPEGRDAIAVERRIAHRGRHRLGPLRAHLVDPFGLAQVGSVVAPEAAFVVYPRVESLGEIAPPEERGGGGRSLVQHLSASGDDFYAVRAWQDGDDLRKIHWRSSARRGELMIRQEEIRPFPRATILIDNRSSMHRDTGPLSSLEWSVSGAASIVWELASQGYALRLATVDGGPGAARWGREATDPLLTTLAVVKRSPNASLSAVVRRTAARPGAGGALVAIMPPPPPDMVPRFASLARTYSWAGLILLDVASFASSSGRERAAFDQRLAEVERALSRAGWRITIAGASDSFRTIWQGLLDTSTSRASSRSLHS
ncbi:MAG TPA: DUF58 domain-containing protein [Actinomycetota bacterium]|nr:DUF58 domain-containing protein [Actinomycetota bacterium]